MRRVLLVGICLVALVSLAEAGGFVSATNVECTPEGVSLAPRWERVYAEGFEGDLSGWAFENFEDKLVIERSAEGAHGGNGLFRVAGNKSGDTAWEMKSKPVAVEAGTTVRLRFWLKNNRGLEFVSGHQGHYESRVEYLDAAGQVVGFTPVVWGEVDDKWHLVTAAGEVPKKAVAAVVRMGFDSPNIGPGEYVLVDDLELEARSEKTGYVKDGEFLSRPIPVKAGWGGLALTQALTPKGTAVSVEMRTAADEGGKPGAWTEFNKPRKEADKLAGWVQYRARLTSADGKATPVLKWVKIGMGAGAVTDTGWTGVDTEAPVLGDHSPTRTEQAQVTLRFKVEDAGVGLEMPSVRVALDGEALAVRREANGEYVAQPAKALAPVSNPGGFRGWRTSNFSNALTIKRGEPRVADGAESMRVSRAAGEVDTAFTLASPEIPVEAGAKYALSVWLRTDVDLRQVDARGARGIRWLNDKGEAIGEPVAVAYGAAGTDWHEVRNELVAPAGAAACVIALGWDTPNLANGRYVEFAEVMLEGPHPARAMGPNLHEIVVTARDLAGNEMRKTWHLLVKEAPKTGLVTVRKDGVTLVDGKPFFPIGIYSVSRRPDNNNSYDDAFKELKAAGFNLAHTYANARGPEFTEFMHAAERQGMKLFMAPETGNNNPDAEGALQSVVRECNEPAVLAWYLADDTSGHISPKDLKRVHEAIMEVDPYHMTTQADGVAKLNDDRYVRYVNSTTGFLPELYPIYQKTGNHVADVIRGMKNVQEAWKAAGRVTPVWAIIQDFEGWGWARFPTDAEERCMVYLAIIHGAQGMTWYTYAYRDDKHGAPWDKKVWAYLKGIATELSSLSGPLTAEAPKEVAKGEVVAGPALGDLEYPSLNLRLLRHEGAWYLLAANSAEAPIKARMTVPGLKGEAEVVFEGRKVMATGGKIVDEFGPLAVHVYRWR
ncbi:MAG: hypothetical protein ABFD96_06515 [Armatimonadia bacterium]